MTLLTPTVMVRANNDVSRMSAQDKVALADDIHARQPNLLAPILVLPRYGVDMLQLEVPIHVLLVAFQAMKHCGRASPTSLRTADDKDSESGDCNDSGRSGPKSPIGLGGLTAITLVIVEVT